MSITIIGLIKAAIINGTPLLFGTSGEILTEKRGSNGFGYDPVFFCTEAGECFGEVSSEEKAKYSHRGRSLALLKEKLKPILEDNNA